MRIIGLIYQSILAAMCCASVAQAAPASYRGLPDCAGGVEIGNAHVARVEKNGALILDDGRAVMLEGIRLPQGEADRAPRYLADEALAALTQMAQERLVLTATPPKEDRYDRVRAQGFARQSDKLVWLQLALLDQGLARVAMAPDRSECAPDLYEAEARARDAGKGIWTSPAYRVRSPRTVKPDAGTFQVVEGAVANVGRGTGRMFIDFTADWKRGFSATIAVDDRPAFRDFDLEGLRGRRIRVRGMVQDFGGRQEIALSNPAQIEIID